MLAGVFYADCIPTLHWSPARATGFGLQVCLSLLVHDCELALFAHQTYLVPGFSPVPTALFVACRLQCCEQSYVSVWQASAAWWRNATSNWSLPALVRDFLNLRCSAVHSRHFCALVCCPQFTCGVWTLLRAEMRAVVAGTVEQRPRSSKRCYAQSHGKPISSCSFAPLGMPLCLII